MKRVIALPLALVLTALLGTGAYFALAPKERVDFLPANAIDVSMETIGVAANDTLLTVNGNKIPAQEYLYWLGSLTSYYRMMYSYSGMDLDLDQELSDGVTWGQQLKDVAYQDAAILALAPDLARRYGVSLDQQDLDALAQSRLDNIENAGGTESYAYQMQAIGIDDEAAYRLDKGMALFNKIQTVAVEQIAQRLTAQDVETYAQENDLLRAKHILLSTADPTTGEELDDAAKAEVKARAEDLLAKAQADPDQFDQLMRDYSEDPGLATSPEGYLFSGGQMVESFEEGTRALEYGQISPLVESDFGYHIILRLDPDCQEVREDLAQDRFSQELQELVDNAQVVTTPAYDSLTTAGYYEKLLAVQAGLAEPDVDDQSYAQLEPVG